MSRVSLHFKLTDRRANRHDESNSLFRQFFAKAPIILIGDFGHCPSSLLTLQDQNLPHFSSGKLNRSCFRIVVIM